MPAGKTLLASVLFLLVIPTGLSAFDDTGWTILYQENFNSTYEAADGQTFGNNNWLVYQLIDGGAMTVANGYVQLNAPDFWNAALIRSVDTLPDHYKVRVKVGYVNYDLTNYEQADYDDPDFNTHLGHYENGVYFLTITDALCSGGQCEEIWWHYHRKMVIDVDNHINWSGEGETFHPVYMVYMDPQTNSGGNLLRTWDGNAWDASPDNWNVAYTYDYDTWYYAELEVGSDYLILRLYDENQNIIEETDPVDLSLVFAMDEPEYLYIGEPHTDDYEGSARFDEITLLVPDTGDPVCGDVTDNGVVDILDIVALVNYKFKGGPEPANLDVAEVTGDGLVNILDIIAIVYFKYKGGPVLVCS